MQKGREWGKVTGSKDVVGKRVCLKVSPTLFLMKINVKLNLINTVYAFSYVFREVGFYVQDVFLLNFFSNLTHTYIKYSIQLIYGCLLNFTPSTP